VPVLISAVTQVGILPVIILILLWDYSKKLASIQVELVKATKNQETILKSLERIENARNN
jgi:hypothetical protein